MTKKQTIQWTLDSRVDEMPTPDANGHDPALDRSNAFTLIEGELVEISPGMVAQYIPSFDKTDAKRGDRILFYIEDGTFNDWHYHHFSETLIPIHGMFGLYSQDGYSILAPGSIQDVEPLEPHRSVYEDGVVVCLFVSYPEAGGKGSMMRPKAEGLVEYPWQMDIAGMDPDPKAIPTGLSIGQYTTQLKAEGITQLTPGVWGQSLRPFTEEDAVKYARFIWHIEKGITYPWHFHAFRERIVTVHGTWILYHANKSIPMEPGSVYDIPAGEPHMGRFMTEDVVIMSINSPGTLTHVDTP